jgi:hypothetical protein
MSKLPKKKKKKRTEHQKLRPIILGTWETEIRKIMVQGQLRQIVCEILSPN